MLLKVSRLSGSCLAPWGLLQVLCPWRGAGAVGCRALLFHGSSWLFAHSLFSLFLLPQDYICPRCESGFIEELPEEPR